MAGTRFQDKVLKASGGVVTYLADLLLFMVAYGVELSTAGYGSKAAGRAYTKTMQDLYGIGERNSLRGFENLKKRGYIKYLRGKSDIEITAAGKRRLRRAVPVYEKKRKWDGRLYLITYDIPESKKAIRDYFRSYLKALGCGMLQASVWITPYDPREVLRKVIRYSRLRTRLRAKRAPYNRLEGEVLISYVGKDSNIAGADFKELVRRVYHLDELNKRYKEFLKCTVLADARTRFSTSSKSPLENWPRYRVAAAFYSILKDDPQLPFELLPKGWKGEEAYKKFSALCRGTIVG